ncbi:MAG: DUF202 domain-containing protein [Planctomycetota bacterium]
MPEIETTLRDRLALRRTALANERTLLAYGRTALMLLASGATLWRYEPLGAGDRVLGAIVVFAGVTITIVGVRRFLQVRAKLDAE